MGAGGQVIRNQMILPRYSVLPMNEAIWAKMRLEVPESPSWLRSPRKASASSIITPTGAMALRMFSTFSRLASVTPCHLERKLRNLTMGMPISPAKAVTMKLLPVPTGPAIR
jgi:hypothetical protein